MIISSPYITTVIKKIDETNSSIFYDPNKFKGYLSDLFNGNKMIIEDFSFILYKISDKIISHTVSSKDILAVKLKGKNCAERKKVQTLLFNAIYIDKNIQDINQLLPIVQNTYSASLNIKRIKEEFSSSIDLFKINKSFPISLGTQVTFNWRCNNPYRLSFSNGYENMDVTTITSINVSAIFDVYELTLYDKNNKIIDKQTINIEFNNNAYCINCGAIFLHDDDLYCTECGTKRFKDAIC